MVETRFEFQQPGYADRVAELLALNEAARLYDLALSERLAREWEAEFANEYAVAA